MEASIKNMVTAISQVLEPCSPSIYLYGSVCLNDFKLGWSDIDLLCLTSKEMTSHQAEKLVTLRQEMLEKDEENPYYRSFEGGILAIDTFLNPSEGVVVYWGTSGQRITNAYRFDSFSQYELLHDGILLHGMDIRSRISPPTFGELKDDIRSHYETIRKYACLTDQSLYSFGWLLDISRCLYTLQTGKIIAKTAAGEWALKNHLCPVESDLEYAVKVRNNPLIYKNNEEALRYATTLGPKIQIYADVLAMELEKTEGM